MRTTKEILDDILAKRKADDTLRSSQFSFCVGGNMLTYTISSEEYSALMQSKSFTKDGVFFGYSLIIE